MARRRIISPELWTDPEVLKLPDDMLLVFIGFISHADDEGILENDPDSIYWKLARRSIVPERIREAIEHFNNVRLVRVYGEYFFLPNWFKHQNLKGNKPQRTKLQRPPKSLLEEYPNYVSEWQDTFKTRQGKEEVSSEYPWESCTSEESINSRDSVANRSYTSSQPVDDQSTTSSPKEKRSKDKIKEEKIIYTGEESTDPPAENTPRAAEPPYTENLPTVNRTDGKFLAKAVNDIFLSQTDGGRYTNPGKEHSKTLELIDRAMIRAPDNPVEFLQIMIGMFRKLKSGRDPYWRKQPFLPSVLSSPGIWDRVYEEAKEELARYDTSWMNETNRSSGDEEVYF